MSKATVSSKGQLTIPADIRAALGLSKGDVVTIYLTAEGATIRKVGSAAALIGSVPARQIGWKSARRQAWRARAERLTRSSATPTSSSGS